MPSEKILEQKKQMVAELVEKLNGACAGVIVDYKGINVADDTKLRADLRAAGVEYAVIKNTLLRRAVEQANLKEIDSALTGTTAVAISTEDYVAAARILCKFADTHKEFSVKSGFLDGEVIDIAKINSLAKLPSREILLATVLNAFNAPIASFARAVQAIADKGGVTEAAPAEEAKAEEVPAETAAAPVEEAKVEEAPAEAVAEAPAEEAKTEE